MSWVRIDDNFLTDPDIIDLPANAFRRYIELLTYSARHLTDGAIPLKIRQISDTCATRTRQRCDKMLAKKALLLSSEQGLFLPRWRDHIEPREKVLQRRKATAERMRKLRCDGVTDGVRDTTPFPARPVSSSTFGTTSAAPKRRRSSSKPKESTLTHQFRQHVEARYTEVTDGGKVVWSGRHGAEAKRVVSALGLEEACRRWDNCCFDPPKWMADGAPDFLTFCSHVDQLATTRAKATHRNGNGLMNANDVRKLGEMFKLLEAEEDR